MPRRKLWPPTPFVSCPAAASTALAEWEKLLSRTGAARSIDPEGRSVSHFPNRGSSCTASPCSYSWAAISRISGGHVDRASAPTRAGAPGRAAKRLIAARRSPSGRPSSPRRPRRTEAHSRSTPGTGPPSSASTATCPVDWGSVLDPKVTIWGASSKRSASPRVPSSTSSNRRDPAANRAMWSAVACARRARAKAARPERCASGDGSTGISDENTGLACPRDACRTRRDPRW